ncbi:S8 family serine peptidase [Ramlibacter algicola]|uniref:S8 family serine peptidase n=1 Tax=Ramlibacter algicola TaxID=2795217 RepID=A0A934PZV4_9BURK|nr:S8 family peptidase [Ramlibacter algicola]MBK0391881.1 S8 family serine peptidase [Ramlibacter algicola]
MRLPTLPRSLALAPALAVLLAACGGGASGPDPAVAQAPAQLATAVQATQLKSAAQPQAPVADTASAAATPVATYGDDGGRRRGSAVPAARRTNSIYIVEMDAAPVTRYDGSIKGLQATRPGKGKKIDPDAPAVVGYMGYLAGRHDAALRGVGNARKVYDYGYVFDGFAAELSDAQAQQLAATKGVLAVTKDELRKMDTNSTPAFLGLSGDNGLWTRTGAKGEGVVVGIVDSGIWPESASFGDRTGVNGNATQDGKLGYQQIPGWHGKCTPGDQFAASNCNQKVIGARWYNAGWGGDAGIRELFPEEFISPRDWGGHGSHTASTAAGNSNVPAGPGIFTSGMAPRARIAVYKVCWSVEPDGGCFGSDSIAAIDQAVADGVDVINFSISGTSTNFRDGVEIAFLNAADAGVFVAASAGNSGPTTQTVAHPSPWVTTVAAGATKRPTVAELVLGNGATYTGSSGTQGSASGSIVNSTAVADATKAADAARLCFSSAWPGGPGLNPALVSGKIVVCERGTNDRVDKSRAVKEAGGVGMVLVNVDPATDSLVADVHSVPTVHLPVANRVAIESYAASMGATASISPSHPDMSVVVPTTADFSSRGPLRASASLLKPDIMGPGVDVLATVAPPGNGGANFALYSGTSMASPHIAGIAALFKEIQPTWSPMMIKSALMTTAYDTGDTGITDATRIFRQGAGFVQPNAATDPGLVFDSSFADWLGFLCGTQLPVSFCTSANVPVIAPSDFNSPSIALGALAGVQTVTRRVTNVGKSSATYTASSAGLTGVTVSMTPASLSIGPGQTKDITLRFARTSANLNAFTGGQLTLTDGKHNVRVPVVARPVALGAPAEATGSYPVTFGYDGAFTVQPRGLVASTRSTGTIATNAVKDFNFTMPAGVTYLRFSLFDADVAAGTDLDLEVYFNGALVGASGGPTAAEEVNFTGVPANAVLTVRVVGFATPAAGTNFTLHSWILDGTSAGNMTVSAPATATTGGTGTVTVGTSGLASGTRYLGSVVYGGGASLPAPTIIRIDN